MTDTADLHVAVVLPGRLGDEVGRYVEAELGWQMVDVHGPLPPALVLAEAVSEATRTVIVTTAPVPGSVVREGLLAGAVDVVGWPDDRERLRSIPAAERRAAAAPHAPVLRVAGSRGGAGASTVALAVGGTVAWSGGRALVVGDEALVRLAGRSRWDGAGSRELASLGAQGAVEVELLARSVAGVAGLSVLGGGGHIAATAGWPYDLVIVDAGTATWGADLVVATADGSLGEVPEQARVVVVEHGPLDRAGAVRALGRPPSGWLPYSARVARAGGRGRVPSALPGSWVAALRRSLAVL